MVDNKRRAMLAVAAGSIGGASVALGTKANPLKKEARTLEMPWEEEYGYAQAVKAGNIIYISGQISHDKSGKIIGIGDVEMQIRQSYKNMQELLGSYGATLQNLVEEVLHVTDIEAAYAAACRCRHDIFGGTPVLASSMIQVPRLAFPDLMIEIRGIATI